MIDKWPDMPTGIEDRDADVWEPLLAVADAAGGDWPERARVAAVTLVTLSKESTPSMGIRLLSDLRVVFGDCEAMSTESVLSALHALDESPWAEWYGKGLSPNQLAKMLKPFDVHPKVVRIAARTPRGYTREDFEDAWKRYLPKNPSGDRNSATSQQERADSGDSPRNSVADGTCNNASHNGQCCDVAAENAIQTVLEAFPGTSIGDESSL